MTFHRREDAPDIGGGTGWPRKLARRAYSLMLEDQGQRPVRVYLLLTGEYPTYGDIKLASVNSQKAYDYNRIPHVVVGTYTYAASVKDISEDIEYLVKEDRPRWIKGALVSLK